jgi:hypothetical protein
LSDMAQAASQPEFFCARLRQKDPGESREGHSFTRHTRAAEGLTRVSIFKIVTWLDGWPGQARP